MTTISRFRRALGLAIIVLLVLSVVPGDGSIVSIGAAQSAGESIADAEADAAAEADDGVVEGEAEGERPAVDADADQPSTNDEPATSDQPSDAEESSATDASADDGDEETPLPVRAIAVRGNRNIPAERILEVITATRVGQALNVEAIQEDLRNIFALGYFEDVRADAFETFGGVRVVFEVIENDIVEEVRIKSDQLQPETIRSWLSVEEGEVLNAIQLDRDLIAVQERALEEASLYLRPARVSFVGGVLDLEFRAARVAEIRVTGFEKTREYVIRREITFEPGDYLTREDLNRSLDRLRRLGFFQDVRVQGIDTDDPDLVIVEFQVEERMTGSAAFGAGYSSQDGFLGYLELADRNFLGRGQQVHARAEFGQRRTTYDVGFYEPYFLNSTMSFGINVYKRSYDRIFRPDIKDENYREQRTGGDLSVGWPLGEFTRGTVRFRIEDLRIDPLDDKGELVDDPSRVRERSPRSVTLSARTDTTDHWLNPLRGFRSRLSAELAGSFLGGDVDFTKYEAEYSQYFQVGSSNQAVAVRLLGGIGIGDLEDVAEEFRVGGTDTLRGYPYGYLRGDRMIVASGEYRFPISESVQGVIFADAGEAWREKDGPSGFKFGYGVGARLDTPLGVLRLDYGFGEDGGRLHFHLGPTF